MRAVVGAGVIAIALVNGSGSAGATAAFVSDCRRIIAAYSKLGPRYGNALPRLFTYQPDFSAPDEGSPDLVASFEIDAVKDSTGHIQCRKDGNVETMELHYAFGAGDFSADRSTIVVRAPLAAIKGGDKGWADSEFKRMSDEAFRKLKTARIKGEDVPFGKAEVDFGPHFAAALVVNPESYTFSASTY